MRPGFISRPSGFTSHVLDPMPRYLPSRGHTGLAVHPQTWGGGVDLLPGAAGEGTEQNLFIEYELYGSYCVKNNFHNPTECSRISLEDGRRSASPVSLGICHLRGGASCCPFL